VSVCAKCGLKHGPGELFVITGVEERRRLTVVDTCELEPAWAAAHAAPQPPGAVAYHATDHLEYVLEHGLDPSRANGNCKHVCLAETAEIAAGTDVGEVVLEVDVGGLDLFFELGEARHHDTVIGPERLRVLDPQPAPILDGWSDPDGDATTPTASHGAVILSRGDCSMQRSGSIGAGGRTTTGTTPGSSPLWPNSRRRAT
jgi:hypothetical protein